MPPLLKKQIKDFDEVTDLNDLSLHLVQFWDSVNSKYITKKITHENVMKDAIGIAEPIEILFNNFKTLLDNDDLVPEQVYKITDYQSFNFLNGYNTYLQNPASFTDFDPTEIYTSSAEVLNVKALTTNTIYPISTSDEFPNDEIYYDPTIEHITEPAIYYDSVDISLDYNLTDGVHIILPNPIGLHFRLYIYAEFGTDLIDVLFNPIDSIINPTSDYDQSDVGAPITIEITDGGTKIKLTSLTEADQIAYTGYLTVETEKSIQSIKGRILRRVDLANEIDVCCDWRNIKYRRFEVTPTVDDIVNNYGTGYWGIGDAFLGCVNTGLYKDVFIFGDSRNPIGFKNISILGSGNVNLQFDNCTIEYAMVDSKIIANDFYNNSFLNITNSELSYYTYNNLLVDINNSKILFGASDNECHDITYCTIGKYFESNKIGYDFRNNIIGNEFINNEIGYEVYNNTIADSFESNVIEGLFRNNFINDEFILNTIDFNFYGNKTNRYWSNNIIGENFANNHTMEFSDNVILDDFRSNDIKYWVDTIDFSVATHVYGDYNCTIFRASDFAIYLSYFNGTAVQYTAIDV